VPLSTWSSLHRGRQKGRQHTAGGKVSCCLATHGFARFAGQPPPANAHSSYNPALHHMCAHATMQPAHAVLPALAQHAAGHARQHTCDSTPLSPLILEQRHACSTAGTCCREPGIQQASCTACSIACSTSLQHQPAAPASSTSPPGWPQAGRSRPPGRCLPGPGTAPARLWTSWG
jgi:hypothetical protein